MIGMPNPNLVIPAPIEFKPIAEHTPYELDEIGEEIHERIAYRVTRSMLAARGITRILEEHGHSVPHSRRSLHRARDTMIDGDPDGDTYVETYVAYEDKRAIGTGIIAPGWSPSEQQRTPLHSLPFADKLLPDFLIKTESDFHNMGANIVGWIDNRMLHPMDVNKRLHAIYQYLRREATSKYLKCWTIEPKEFSAKGLGSALQLSGYRRLGVGRYDDVYGRTFNNVSELYVVTNGEVHLDGTDEAQQAQYDSNT